MLTLFDVSTIQLCRYNGCRDNCKHTRERVVYMHNKDQSPAYSPNCLLRKVHYITCPLKPPSSIEICTSSTKINPHRLHEVRHCNQPLEFHSAYGLHAWFNAFVIPIGPTNGFGYCSKTNPPFVYGRIKDMERCCDFLATLLDNTCRRASF